MSAHGSTSVDEVEGQQGTLSQSSTEFDEGAEGFVGQERSSNAREKHEHIKQVPVSSEESHLSNQSFPAVSENKVNPNRPYFPARARDILNKPLEYSGILVFVFTSISVIIFTILFNFRSTQDGNDFLALRSSELMIALAASGLVVAIVGRANNPFVLAFGVFLIGALIVPSNDLVRFALIASGSEKRYQDFLEATSAGADLAGRSSDVASKILTELETNGLISLETTENRKRAITIIEREIRNEREITLLEQVKAFGAFDALKAISDNVDEWIYKYSDESRFLDDLRYLRSENLIAFPYDDYHSTEVTLLGQSVLRREFHRSPTTSGLRASERREDPLESTLLDLMNLIDCPFDPGAVPFFTQELTGSEGREFSLGERSEYMAFQVTSDGNYQIDLEATSPRNSEPQSDVDPVIWLFEMQGEQCRAIGLDDDGGTSLNSQLILRLQENSVYVIDASTIAGSGLVVAKVSRIDA